MSGRVVLVTAVGAASGSRAAAAALACAGSEPDRPGLLIDVGGRPPRPTLVASAGARELEERLAAHLPQLRAASRGQTCHLAVPADEGALRAVRAALPLVRDRSPSSTCRRRWLQALLAAGSIPPAPAPRRSRSDRALTALAVARPARSRPARPRPQAAARLGACSPCAVRRPAAGCPGRPALPLVDSLLESEISAAHACYAELDDPETDPAGTAQQQRRGDAGAGRGRGLHRDPERQARR